MSDDDAAIRRQPTLSSAFRSSVGPSSSNRLFPHYPPQIAKQSCSTAAIVSQNYCVNQDHQSVLTPLGILDLHGAQKTPPRILDLQGAQKTPPGILDLQGAQKTLLGVLDLQGAQKTPLGILDLQGAQKTLLWILDLQGAQKTLLGILDLHGAQKTLLGILDLQGAQKTLLGVCHFEIKAVSPRLLQTQDPLSPFQHIPHPHSPAPSTRLQMPLILDFQFPFITLLMVSTLETLARGKPTTSRALLAHG
ncbi:hypothetical protein ACOMHN_027326 [Nucella lapillus]